MARLVEVWNYFRNPLCENEMIRMCRTFNIINLDKCTYEFHLPTDWPKKGLCQIVFYYDGKIIHTEECSTLDLAKARLDWLSTFESKKESGEFEYKGMLINVDEVVAILNETSETCRTNDATAGERRKIRLITPKIEIKDSVNCRGYYTILEELQKKFIR